MPEHPYGWLSLMPPVVAIVLAIFTRQAVASLIAGLLCGALLTSGGNPLVAVYDLCEVHLWPTFVDDGKLRLFSFTLLMGALIGIISRCGGMQGFVNLLSPLARTRRSGQLVTWLMGLAIFFDDYANTILLGNTMRSLCDRLRISREKLAYLVDSTAAPVAGLSLLSTWVAVEIEYLAEGVHTLGDPAGFSPFDLFVASIPYRFYVLGSLMLIPLLAWSGRDFGPMLAAERERLNSPDDLPPDDAAAALTRIGERVRASGWWNAVVPIVVTLVVVLTLMLSTGRQALARSALESGAPAPVDAPLRDLFGAADSGLALQYGALSGVAAASALCLLQRLLTSREVLDAALQGASVVLPAIAILWCASALSRMTGDKSVDGQSSVDDAGRMTYAFRDHRLYTGEYLTGLIDRDEPGAAEARGTTLKLLPTVVFVLAAIVSFCTGTSFGTMGILVPMVVTLCYALLDAAGGGVSPRDPLLLASIGSVLAGAVFGDHCSPISDTTILSSQSCACDHMAHVVTQLPYALSVAAVTIVCGTLPIGFGAPIVWLLPLQAAALAAIVYLFGKRP
jgi:Na+/H+ antiporter NhaC